MKLVEGDAVPGRRCLTFHSTNERADTFARILEGLVATSSRDIKVSRFVAYNYKKWAPYPNGQRSWAKRPRTANSRPHQALRRHM